MPVDPIEIPVQHAIGLAIEQWGIVEDALCYTYITSVCGINNNNIGPASAAFWATHSFRNKLEVTNAAVSEVMARDCVLSTWETMHSRLKRRNKKRNELAHFSIMHEYSKDGKHQTKVYPYFSQSKHLGSITAISEQMKMDDLTTPHRLPKKIQGFGAKDILQRADAFKKTGSELRNFNRALKSEIRYQTLSSSS